MNPPKIENRTHIPDAKIENRTHNPPKIENRTHIPNAKIENRTHESTTTQAQGGRDRVSQTVRHISERMNDRAMFHLKYCCKGLNAPFNSGYNGAYIEEGVSTAPNSG